MGTYPLILTYSGCLQLINLSKLSWVLTVGNKETTGSAVCGTSSVPLFTFGTYNECTCWSQVQQCLLERTDRVEHSISNHHQDHNQDKSFSLVSQWPWVAWRCVVLYPTVTRPVQANLQTSLWPLPAVLVRRVSTWSVSWVPPSPLPQFPLPPAYTCQWLFTTCCIRDVATGFQRLLHIHFIPYRSNNVDISLGKK